MLENETDLDPGKDPRSWERPWCCRGTPIPRALGHGGTSFNRGPGGLLSLLLLLLMRNAAWDGGKSLAVEPCWQSEPVRVTLGWLFPAGSVSSSEKWVQGTSQSWAGAQEARE